MKHFYQYEYQQLSLSVLLFVLLLYNSLLFHFLIEINHRYYGLSLMRTLTRGPYSVRFKGSWLFFGGIRAYVTVHLSRKAYDQEFNEEIRYC